MQAYMRHTYVTYMPVLPGACMPVVMYTCMCLTSMHAMHLVLAMYSCPLTLVC